MKILFLEDESELNEMGTQQLKTLGHEVVSAKNIDEARALFAEQEKSINLIIADQRLPDGNGVQFLAEIRLKSPSVNMAVVSGFLCQEDREILKKLDIPFFTKPLIYSVVLKKLKKPPPALMMNKPVASGSLPPKVPSANEDIPIKSKASPVPPQAAAADQNGDIPVKKKEKKKSIFSFFNKAAC